MTDREEITCTFKFNWEYLNLLGYDLLIADKLIRLRLRPNHSFFTVYGGCCRTFLENQRSKCDSCGNTLVRKSWGTYNAEPFENFLQRELSTLADPLTLVIMSGMLASALATSAKILEEQSENDRIIRGDQLVENWSRELTQALTRLEIPEKPGRARAS